MYKKKHILWDLDGTIVESEDIVFKFNMFEYASNKINIGFNLNPEAFVGHEAKNIYKAILEENNIENKKFYWEIYQDWHEYAVEYILTNIKSVKPRANVIDLWQTLSHHGITHSVVTSSRKDVATSYLKNIGLYSSCETLTCIDDVSTPKPSPIPYITAMNKLNICTDDCIAIEDSITGISSAKSAGLYTIAWVVNSALFLDSKADLVLERIETSTILNLLKE